MASTQGVGLTQQLAISAPGVMENKVLYALRRLVSLGVWLGEEFSSLELGEEFNSLSYNYVTMSGNLRKIL